MEQKKRREDERGSTPSWIAPPSGFFSAFSSILFALARFATEAKEVLAHLNGPSGNTLKMQGPCYYDYSYICESDFSRTALKGILPEVLRLNLYSVLPLLSLAVTLVNLFLSSREAYRAMRRRRLLERARYILQQTLSST